MSKKPSVPRGHVPVLVGTGNQAKRIVVHTRLLTHRYFSVLLELSAHEFGYNQDGILRIPCELEHFWDIVFMITKTKCKIGNVFTSPLYPCIDLPS